MEEKVITFDDHKMQEVILVSAQEYVLLSASAGMKEMYGFDMHADQMSEEEVVLALQALSQRGFVESDGGKIILKNKAKQLFEQIRDADTMMDIHKKSGRKCILYIADYVVKVAQSLRRQDKYELSMIDKNGIWTHLQEEGWVDRNV